MARLPNPGGDNGTWGVILNDFLAVSFDQEGILLTDSVGADAIQDGAVTADKFSTANVYSQNKMLVYKDFQMRWVDIAHTHTQADITNLSTDLAAKANVTHVHSGADITSGTIAAARLPAATEADAGAVALASTAEVISGTNTTKAVTPAGVAAVVNAVANPIVFVNSLDDIPPGTPVDTLVVVRAA